MPCRYNCGVGLWRLKWRFMTRDAMVTSLHYSHRHASVRTLQLNDRTPFSVNGLDKQTDASKQTRRLMSQRMGHSSEVSFHRPPQPHRCVCVSAHLFISCAALQFKCKLVKVHRKCQKFKSTESLLSFPSSLPCSPLCDRSLPGLLGADI